MRKNRPALCNRITALYLVIFFTLSVICSTAWADCIDVPDKVNTVDAVSDASKARAVFSSNNYTFTLNFPAYCNLVDIRHPAKLHKLIVKNFYDI